MRFRDDDILVEVLRSGDWQRVAVLHVGSGREVVVHGSAATPTAVLVAHARHRLRAAERRCTSKRPATGNEDHGILA